MTSPWLVVSLMVARACTSQAPASLTPVELTCEYAVDPLGIDVARPRFGWVLQSKQRGQMQSAYQVLVAGSEEKLRANVGNKWDSGKVESGRSVNVAYGGKALAGGEKCWWKVRAWDNSGKAGAYSKPATFEMGLLEPLDWQGKWIGADKEIASPLLRKEFTLAKYIRRARVYATGLGWFELYLNGRKVGGKRGRRDAGQRLVLRTRSPEIRRLAETAAANGSPVHRRQHRQHQHGPDVEGLQRPDHP